MKQTYDIFISYRRSSYESANLIATRLRAAGYRVFFDLETMRSGPFNKQLYQVIETCKDFILVLPPDALDRCHNEEDWVRKEVLHAIKHQRNIIPILLNGFKWPEKMPAGMENLCMYQGVAASIDYFDLAMKRLESYLKSRRYTKARICARWFVAIMLIAVALVGVLQLLFRELAKPVCEEVVEHLTLKIAMADFMISDNNLLLKTWNTCSPANQEEIAANMQVVQANLAAYESTINSTLELSSWQDFLLSYYDTDAMSIRHIDEYIQLMYHEMTQQMIRIGTTASKKQVLPSEYNLILSLLELYPHMGASVYYSYLQMLNQFPESSLAGYQELASQWLNMPKTGLGLKQAEYEVLVKQTDEYIDKTREQWNIGINDVQDTLYEQEQKLDSLHRTVLAQYKEYVAKFAVRKENDLGRNWGNVMMAAALMESMTDAYNDSVAAGDDPGYVTPELALADLNKTLDDFQQCYPNAEYVASAKVFYKQNLTQKWMGGVLITGFAPNTSHDVYQIGDIITAWNGERIYDLEGLKKAYAKASTGKLKLLRMNSDNLQEITLPIPGNEDIVAFVNLIAK